MLLGLAIEVVLKEILQTLTGDESLPKPEYPSGLAKLKCLYLESWSSCSPADTPQEITEAFDMGPCPYHNESICVCQIEVFEVSLKVRGAT